MQRDAAGVARPGARGDLLVVRIDASTADWPRRLPAVPPGTTVTMTVSSSDLVADADLLCTRGYVLVDVVPAPLLDGDDLVVDLVVPCGLADDWPGWWAAVTAVASGVFAAAHGPVSRVFADLLTAHQYRGGSA